MWIHSETRTWHDKNIQSELLSLKTTGCREWPWTGPNTDLAPSKRPPPQTNKSCSLPPVSPCCKMVQNCRNLICFHEIFNSFYMQRPSLLPQTALTLFSPSTTYILDPCPLCSLHQKPSLPHLVLPGQKPSPITDLLESPVKLHLPFDIDCWGKKTV